MKIEFILFRLLKIKFAGRGRLKAVRDFIYALLLLMFVHNNSSAQVYPVQATPQLIAPYSLYLSDYVAPASERLVLNVMLNDISKPAIDVRFRLRIVGQNITIETKQEFMPPPVQLHGGIPLRLISADLADYFDPKNLNFTGITRREYEQRGKLPEGAYQFCFEVLEYNRGVKISNTGCATAWMILNDPPIINLPMQNAKVIPTSPQNVILQWTPRHTGSPNSAFTTEYDIKMVEVWPATRQPNDAILTSPPIFEATTQSTTLIYGPAETPLELGRRYAFRVQAKSIVGIDQLDLFKNNGYSEVFTFVYGDACSAPADIEVTTLGSNKFSLQWTGQPNHTAFKVQYRPAGTQNWYDNNTSITNADIYSLKPSTTYEYQVSGTCGFFDGTYSTIATVKTKDEPPMSYSCGLPLEKFSLDPSELAPSLKVGDVIHAGDFNVELTKVSGGNGVFSGEGILPLSFFNKAKVKGEFTNATINKDLRLINGYFNVTGAGVDIVPAGLVNLMEKLDEAINIADSALSLAETMIPDEIPNPASFVADTLVAIQGEILAVVKNPISGKVIVTTTTGQTQELSPGTSYAVTDSKGKGYLVDSNGNVGKTTAELAKQTAKREYNLMLAFNPASNTVYGYDKKSTDPKYNTLKGYEVLKDGYSVPWKAVATGSTDYVQAELTKSEIDKTRIHFELEGTPLSAAPMGSGSTTSLAVPGHVAGVEEDITAVFSPSDTSKKSQLLGKMKVIAYNGVNYNLVLIPVNTAEYPSGNITNLKTQLNTIYAQAAVSWNITLNGKLQVDLDDTFDDGSSGLLSNYTGDMNKVINAFGSPFVANTYYLFLVQKPASGKVLGFMPRSKQAGFIFVDMFGSDETRLINTIAHELGHGAFTLKHSFDSDELNLPKGDTDNLMDYAETSGSKLLKYQWDRIHNPVEVLGLFESDQEGQSQLVSKVPPELVSADGRTITFISPGGTLVVLPSFSTNLTFAYGFNNFDDDFIVPGTLLSFEYKGEIFNLIRSTRDGMFTGYTTEKNKIYKPSDFLTSDDITGAISTAILMLPCGDGKVSLAKFSVDNFSLEKGDFTSFKTISDFPLRPYSKNKLLAEKVYDISNLPDLFDFGDHRYEISSDIFDFLKGDCGQNYFFAKVKVSEYYSINPILFSNFYLSSITNRDEKYWINSIDQFKSYVTNSKKILAEKLDKISLNTTSDEWESIFMLMGPEDYQNLTYTQRLLLLKISSKFISFGNGDKWIRNLVVLIKNEEDEKKLLDDLIVEKDAASNHILLTTLLVDFKGVDGNEFNEMVSALVGRVFKYYPIPKNFDYKIALTNGEYMSFDPSYWVGDEVTKYFNDKGEVVLKTSAGQGRTLTVHPFKYIVLESYRDYDISGIKLVGGAKLKMPALYAYMLFNNLNTQRILKSIRLAIDVASLVIGVGELNVAIETGNAFRLTRSLADIGVGLSDITFNHVLDQYLVQSEAGKNFLNAWGNVMLAYGVLRIGDEFFNAQLQSMEKSLAELSAEEKVLSKEQLAELNKAKEDLQKKLNINESSLGVKLSSQLKGSLKGIYEDLVSRGINFLDDGQSIRFFNPDGSLLAILNDKKFTPSVWTLQRKKGGVVISNTSEGYNLIKNADNYAFELGYKEGRVLSGEEVNSYHKGIGNHEPYKQGTVVIERSLEAGDKIYVVENSLSRVSGDKIPNPGGWGSKNMITTEKELRDYLAVLEEWKKANGIEDPLVVREYTVKAKLKVRDGIIGPQMEVFEDQSFKIYFGGEQQYEFIDFLGNGNWENYLIVKDISGFPLK